MKIDRISRLMLFNQFEILKTLNPTSGINYDNLQEIVRSGFELEYSEVLNFVSPDDDTTPEAICLEVLDILDMFRVLHFKAGKELLEKHKYSMFNGFDGNEEPKHYWYCKFVIESTGRFEELRNYGTNSHSRRVPHYGAMLREYARCSDRYNPSLAEIDRIFTAT